MHSCIERKIKREVNIYNMERYVSLICTARSKRPFYKVERLTHKDFLDFGSVNTVTSIRPGKNRPGEPEVGDIKQIKYTGAEIKVKLDHTGEWQPLPKVYPVIRDKPLRLYSAQLPIKLKKYNHIQSMKLLIPQIDPITGKNNWELYDNLPHNLTADSDDSD